MRPSFPRRPYLIIWSLAAALQLVYWLFFGQLVLYPKGGEASVLQIGTFWAPFVIAPALGLGLRRGGRAVLWGAAGAQAGGAAWFAFFLTQLGSAGFVLILPPVLAGAIAAALGCTARTYSAFQKDPH